MPRIRIDACQGNGAPFCFIGAARGLRSRDVGDRSRLCRTAFELREQIYQFVDGYRPGDRAGEGLLVGPLCDMVPPGSWRSQLSLRLHS